MSLYEEISTAININSRENQSGTPDFILAHYLINCLKAFETAVAARDRHAGVLLIDHDAPIMSKASHAGRIT